MAIKAPARLFAYLLLAFAAMAALAACGPKPGPVGNSAVPAPAKPVEIEKYLGKWYEMARYEASFQRGCDFVTAEYARRDDGKIKVVNACVKDGKVSRATGKAKIVENSQNAKLKVSFFGPFYGDYWILDRADDYSWAIIGEPSGSYLWMLTRAAKPDEQTRALIKSRLLEMGYDWSLVRITKQ